jgi:hypothetical protein
MANPLERSEPLGSYLADWERLTPQQQDRKLILALAERRK